MVASCHTWCRLSSHFSWHSLGRKYNHFFRVVNIAVLVSLPILSAILLEYWHHDYCWYFSFVVSKWVSAILFQLFLAIFNTNTFVSKQRRCGCCTTSRGVSARTHAVRPRCTVQGDVGPKLHAMDTRAGVRLLRGWKNKCQDSQQTHKRLHWKPTTIATVQLTLRAFVLPVIAHPSSLNLITAVNCRPQLTDDH